MDAGCGFVSAAARLSGTRTRRSARTIRRTRRTRTMARLRGRRRDYGSSRVAEPDAANRNLRIGMRRGSSRRPAEPCGTATRRRSGFRNAVIFVSVVLVIGVFLLNARGAWHFNESVSLAMTIGWIGATWQSYGVRGRSTVVPTSLSWNELRAFHRRELIRQMDLGCREFVYWSVPAVLLILYALAVAVPRFRGG